MPTPALFCTAPLELRVLAGRQAGARALLDAHEAQLVCGLNAANQADTQFADILLASGLDFQVRLLPTGPGRVGLQLLSGLASLQGRPLPPATRCTPGHLASRCSWVTPSSPTARPTRPTGPSPCCTTTTRPSPHRPRPPRTPGRRSPAPWRSCCWLRSAW